MRNWMRMLARGWAAHVRRQSTVDTLSLLTDHLLLDMGLRRDQLDLLRVPEEPVPAAWSGPNRTTRRQTALQGCG